MSMRRECFPFIGLMILLILPAILLSFSSKDFLPIIKHLFIPPLFFIVPIILFYGNIRVYLYALLPLVIVTPFFLFFIYIFYVPPGFPLIAFILQTNLREMREAITPFLFMYVPFTVLYVALYLFLMYRVSVFQIPLKHAIVISGLATLMLGGITFYENGLYDKPRERIYSSDFLLSSYYPGSLISGVNEARVFLQKNNLKRAEKFSFKAVRNDSLPQRQVYVLIIGESSRYDRWQINGYQRPTSPMIASRENFITFSDVVAGAHYTWVSVPQIITRATPDNYDAQFREKSILSAFHDAGFKTFWLSNQSDQDIFWSGTITLHAKTADVSIFSPTYSPNLEFDDVYDGRLLPFLDSVLAADKQNQFIILHTMGSHWEYSRRYPDQFDVFRPSGKTQSINPPENAKREAILNSYDNSILYADFIIDSVIRIVEHHADIAAVTFISDHGEDLFDSGDKQLDFHFRASPATLRVPLFIWTSDGYATTFREKHENLLKNKSRKVGTENIFHTGVDMANLRFAQFDSTKSLASGNFQPSDQKFYADGQQARTLSQIP